MTVREAPIRWAANAQSAAALAAVLRDELPPMLGAQLYVQSPLRTAAPLTLERRI